MNNLLAQAITLPGINNNQTPIAYPQEMNGFLFQGPQGTIGNIISTAIPIVIGIAGLGLLLMIIVAGYALMTSAGDAKKMEQGKQQLTSMPLWGSSLSLCAYWLCSFWELCLVAAEAVSLRASSKLLPKSPFSVFKFFNSVVKTFPA